MCVFVQFIYIHLTRNYTSSKINHHKVTFKKIRNSARKFQPGGRQSVARLQLYKIIFLKNMNDYPL